MILGQAESEGTGWLDIAVGVISWPAKLAIDAIARARGSGGDVDAAAEENIPQIPAPDDVTSPVGTGKATARRPTPQYGDTPDAGYENASTGASLWPWLLGVGLVAGGAYWLTQRKKGKRK